MRRVEIACWLAAALALGAYAFVYLDRTVYQTYQEWSFQQALGHKPADVPGFLRRLLQWGDGAPPSEESAEAFREFHASEPRRTLRPLLEAGSPIGRIEIPRVGVEAIIVESTTSEALRRAVGHIEGTALPGDDGNVGLAGHRDTFFRGLRDVRKGDTIRIDTLEGSWQYRVESTRIVDPGDIEVLKTSASPTLTLVTCYPFSYVGAAPRRFVVQAREIRPTKSGGVAKQAADVRPKPSPGF